MAVVIPILIVVAAVGIGAVVLTVAVLLGQVTHPYPPGDRNR